MANTIKMKQSSVASKVPQTTDLALGELAVNTYDGKLYLKKNVSGTETVVEVGSRSPRVSSTASSATITPTSDASEQYNVTALATAANFAAPSGTPTDGQRLLLRIKDDGTARALTWTTTSGGYRAIGVTLPTTTVASKVLYVGCLWNSQDSYWDVTAVAQQ